MIWGASSPFCALPLRPGCFSAGYRLPASPENAFSGFPGCWRTILLCPFSGFFPNRPDSRGKTARTFIRSGGPCGEKSFFLFSHSPLFGRFLWPSVHWPFGFWESFRHPKRILFAALFACSKKNEQRFLLDVPTFGQICR